jgi:hypothetical protein
MIATRVSSPKSRHEMPGSMLVGLCPGGTNDRSQAIYCLGYAKQRSVPVRDCRPLSRRDWMIVARQFIAWDVPNRDPSRKGLSAFVPWGLDDRSQAIYCLEQVLSRFRPVGHGLILTPG